MTPDTLDRAGRRAADALRADLADLDTDAALEALLAGAADAPAPTAARSGGRRWLAVAAVAAVLAGSAVAIVAWDRSGDDDVRTGDAPAIDPADYGPVIGRLVSQQDPNLVAEVHGPEPLGAADEVAIVVTGAQPGRQYGLRQCLRATLPEVHPGTSCNDGWPPIVIGPDGSGVAAITLAPVFVGMLPRGLNDCRVRDCDLRVESMIDDDEPDAGVPGTGFVSQDDPFMQSEQPTGAPSPWIPLSFDPDSRVPTPTLSVRDLGGGRAAISGSGLQAGRVAIVAEGWVTGSPPPLMVLAPDGIAEVAELAVGDDGSFTAEVQLPAGMVNGGKVSTEIDGSTREGSVDCSAADAWCWVRVEWSEPTFGADGQGALVPDPVPYPAP